MNKFELFTLIYFALDAYYEDEVKTNNSIDNLEWCDAKYNNNYGTRNQRVA